VLKHLITYLCLIPIAISAQTLPGCEVISADDEATVTAKRVTTLLSEKKFLAVEDEFSDKLRRYRQGTYNDILFTVELQRAAGSSPSTAPLLQMWVNERKDSFFAHLLLAHYRTNLGYEKRGGELYAQTSQEQIVAMRQEFNLAVASYREAIKLDAKSSLPLAGLMRTLRPTTSKDTAWELLTQANRNDSKNLAARREMIYSLAPRWGGSLEEFDKYLERLKTENLSTAHIRYLTYIVEMQKGLHHERITKEYTKAIRHWNLALDQCQYSGVALTSIMNATTQLQDWEQLKIAASRFLVIAPQDSETLVRRAWANEKLSRFEEMERDYLAASNLGNSYAQNRIGYFYMVGHPIKRDLVKARGYLEMAAKNGNPNAGANLDWLTKYGEKR
jgi:Sel1 repeat